MGALQGLVPDFDCLAVIGPREIAALEPISASEWAPEEAERLRTVAQDAQERGDPVSVAAGWASIGEIEVAEPGLLIDQARHKLARRSAA